MRSASSTKGCPGARGEPRIPSAVARACSAGLGAMPPVEFRGKAPGRGEGVKTPKADSNLKTN